MVRIGKEAAQLRSWSLRQRLGALKRIIPRQQVTAALRRAGCGQTPCRRTSDEFMVWFVVALGLFCCDCYRQIYRWLVPWKPGDVPGRSTLCEARHRLGVAPLVRLAAAVVHLLARPATPGAFYQGLRLMAVDGFVVDLPDTPENDRVFRRRRSQHGVSGFPQARVLGLMEVGTHVFWRWLIKDCHSAEAGLVRPLLKHLQGGMLLLWDRGFVGFELVEAVQKGAAQLLAHWKLNRILRPRRRLADGSYLARLYRHDSDRRADRHGIDVRVIEYRLADPARDPKGEVHRLVTTLLDERQHPASTLVELYHVRWEEELAIDEFKTHEMERPVLRSQTPAGVVQELYGLMLAHYLLRCLMFEAAKRVATSPVRMSFTGTLKILRCRLPECPQSPQGRQQWWRHLLAEVAEENLPPRRDRINPRVIKKQQSAWPTKRPHHRRYPQPTQPFRDSIVMLH
jgi:hypothetical protein